MDSDVVKFFWVMATLGLSGVVVYAGISLVNLFTRRLEGRSGGDREDLEYLKDRVAQVDGLEQRVAELETRLDFAERLLTSQTREPTEISPHRDHQ